MSSTGKIARLPHHLREDLNHRLLDNESAETLLDWLNRQPDTQKILAQHFDGHPITPQNLSEWRTGGFAAWELRHDLLATAADLAETSDELNAIADRLVDRLATVLASRYASLLLHWDGEVTDEFNQKVRVLGSLCRAITQLRKFSSSPADLSHRSEARAGHRQNDLIRPNPSKEPTSAAESLAIGDCLSAIPSPAPAPADSSRRRPTPKPGAGPGTAQAKSDLIQANPGTATPVGQSLVIGDHLSILSAGPAPFYRLPDLQTSAKPGRPAAIATAASPALSLK